MVQLAPMSVGEVLDAAIKVLRRHWRPILGTAGVSFLPYAYVSWVSNVDLLGSVGEIVGVADLGGFFRLLLFTMVFLALGTLVTKSVAILYVDAYLANASPRFGDVAGRVARRFPALLANRLVVWVMTGLGAIFCALPGIWIGVSWSMAHPALLMENHGPMDALGRSFSLVRNRFWPLLGWAATLYVLSSALNQLGSAALQAVLFADDNETGFLILATVSSYLATAMLWAMVGTSGAVMLVDLKIRREAYDLHQMADQLAAEPAAPTRLDLPPPPPTGSSDWIWTPPTED